MSPTPQEVFFNSFYLGYIIVDWGWLIYNSAADLTQTIHHCCAVAGYLTILILENHAFEFTVIFSCLEVSSVILNARGVLKFHKLYDTWHPYINLAYVIMFFICRVVIFYAIGLFFLLSPHTAIDMVFWWGSCALVNLVFFKRAVSLAVKSWTSQPKSKHT